MTVDSAFKYGIAGNGGITVEPTSSLSRTLAQLAIEVLLGAALPAAL